MLSFLIFMISTSLQAQESISFNTSIKTCIKIEKLWSEFERSMTNSNQSSIWPNKHSEVSGEGIYEDSKIYVNYKLGLVSPTYAYSLSNIIEHKTFTYSANPNSHLFIGGATITLTEEKDHTLLEWLGEYQTLNNQWIQRLIFKRYEKNFFETLEKNIKAYENAIGCE